MASIAPPDRNDVVRIRGQRWRVVGRADFGEAAVLDVLGCDHDNRAVEARFLLPCERVERLAPSDGPRVVRLAAWRHVARLELAGAAPGIDSLRAATRAAIRIIPFQLEPAMAVARGLASRILIADAVGLGKTIQAALIVAETLERAVDGHALVLCPASLRDQWRQELRDRFRLDAAVVDSTSLVSAAWTALPGANPWCASRVVVASIDYAKRPEVIRALESIVWDAAVLDEAHTLTGPSERAHAAGALARRARLVVMLSATPHSGDPGAFSRLVGTGRLPGDPPLLMFRRGRGDVGLTAARRTRWLRVRSTSDEIELHRQLVAYARLVWRQQKSPGARLAVSVLMKRACSSAASARRSLERRLTLLSRPDPAANLQIALPFDVAAADDMEPDALLAAPGLHDAEDELRRLDRLVAQASRASRHESKLDALHRLLRRAGEPTIVFTEYRDTLSQIASSLPRHDSIQLHGGLTSSERREALRAFTNGSARILLATDAASEGLNLHHRCRLVVTMELPWTPVRLEQRVGRVDRIGQSRRVHAVHLVAGNTAEEQTIARLFLRTSEATAALSAAPAAIGERDVAGMVVGEASAPEPSGSTTADGIRLIDLRAAAVIEGERVDTARSLQGTDASAATGRRAVITSRRTLRAADSACYWAFRSSFDDPAGRVIWSSLMAVSARARRREARTSRTLRVLLNPDHPHVREAVVRAHEEALTAMMSHLRPWLELARRREHDIAEDIERTRARLAAHQRGLFDRRAERAALAQTAITNDALARCADRLGYLARLGAPVPGAHPLVFAIALE
jgi:superfamily II DNA or RNA helicase